MPVSTLIPASVSAVLLPVAVLLATTGVLAVEREDVGTVVNFRRERAGCHRTKEMGQAGLVAARAGGNGRVLAAACGCECIERIRGVANAFLNCDDLLQHPFPLSPTRQRRRWLTLWLNWRSVVPARRRLLVALMV